MKETKYQIEIIIRLKDSYVKTHTRSKGINAVGVGYFVSGHEVHDSHLFMKKYQWLWNNYR